MQTASIAEYPAREGLRKIAEAVRYGSFDDLTDALVEALHETGHWYEATMVPRTVEDAVLPALSDAEDRVLDAEDKIGEVEAEREALQEQVDALDEEIIHLQRQLDEARQAGDDTRAANDNGDTTP